MDEVRVREAIESSDTDELLRIVDATCSAEVWDDLTRLRLLLAEALERGRQLWGVDQHIRYRLALEAPPPLAASAVEEGPARFALGPLTEVVANRHTFAALSDHLRPGPNRQGVAYERVAAGEVIDPAEGRELPTSLRSWEPAYQLPVYQKDRVESSPPPLSTLGPVDLPQQAETVDDLRSTEALLALVLPWLEESNGRGQAVCVDGPPAMALRALGVPAARLGPLSTSEAVAHMAWAAASGGAMGRRRGLAFGRFASWYVLATLGGWDWPASVADIDEATEQLQWFAWSDLAPDVGWALHLAASHADEGLSWAIGVRDAH